ncbi:hypothetical protein FSZ31_08540 [Sphingorhabdus soli]|uniref:DUF4261 domain-containing protein n=1 Tax=Flavisphingopyxis soli TaxID=2601267 RepID=A0A5C6U825_9SPHN|nr:hypothetical protein [Sphingorhabdus soli]TXC68984.1 hypothetical protein FSZ31_08540 [Sphingorhabdus soli]
MTGKASTSLPSGSALLTGIPAHLLDDDTLSASLRRMGLSPGDPQDVAFDGVVAREWAIGFPACSMRVARIVPSGAMAKRLAGRYPGLGSADFAPPEDRTVILSWHGAALRMPDGDLETILTTLALLSAFLFPRQIQWCPARLWSEAPEITRGIEKYLGGAPLPVLHLVGFDRGSGEGAARIVTRGLGVFTGQELTADATQLGAAETVRRLARLVLDMIENGPVLRNATIDGLLPSETIVLSPKPGIDGNDLVDIAIHPA